MSKVDMRSVLDSARRVLDIEEKSLSAVGSRLGEEFVKAIQILSSCEGRVVFAGMGKSGLVCRKIAATFASTGTPALFVHPAEVGHGDLGMLMRGDILVAVTYSGETEEIVRLLPAVKRLGIPVICMTGVKGSRMAKRADVILDISVKEEACSLGLAPTASTTVTMALGDALAVALLELRGFTEEDFALFHPDGAIGRKLKIVEDIMHSGEEIPVVTDSAKMKEALFEITSKKLGFTTVVDESRRLVGIITDGDLRRIMETEEDIFSLTAGHVMTTDPKTIEGSAMAARALQIMESRSITSLVIIGGDGTIEGVLHLHDILRAGIA
ncbi:MAG: SIS domain-containing protein [bacterium]